MFSKPRVSLKEHVAEKKVKKGLEAYLVLLCRQINQCLCYQVSKTSAESLKYMPAMAIPFIPKP